MKTSNLVRAALWVKNHTHRLRVIGATLFLLGIFTALFWLAGKDVEPLAFLLVTLSSVLFASPAIAEAVVPSPKPIHSMNAEEMIYFLSTTEADSDWTHVHAHMAEEAFYKGDPRLRITARHDEEGLQNENFIEPWANNFPDKRAQGHYYDLAYDGELLERFILVSVDGGRARLPLPYPQTLEVDIVIFKVAQIFDTLSNLGEYMSLANFTVRN
jgi:hypothetical protein